MEAHHNEIAQRADVGATAPTKGVCKRPAAHVPSDQVPKMPKVGENAPVLWKNGKVSWSESKKGWRVWADASKPSKGKLVRGRSSESWKEAMDLLSGGKK